MLNVGDAVVYVDEVSVPHTALITAIWNATGSIDLDVDSDHKACINVLYVSSDADKRDPYGRQIERASSVQGKSEHSAHGRYWIPVG